MNSHSSRRPTVIRLPHLRGASLVPRVPRSARPTVITVMPATHLRAYHRLQVRSAAKVHVPRSVIRGCCLAFLSRENMAGEKIRANDPRCEPMVNSNRPPDDQRTIVQVHLRLRAADAKLLHALAEERDQTISALVRSLLKPFRDSATREPKTGPGSVDKNLFSGR